MEKQADKTGQTDKRGFIKKHPVIFNLALMALAAFALVWVALLYLDVWTEHGKYVDVPQVRDMSYNEAVDKLGALGFHVELADSVYDGSTKPGTVLEQSPRVNSRVKPNRTIYLTINAFSPKMVTVPNLTDMSLRQAQSVLQGLGIRNVKINNVLSEYKDLVLGATFDGVTLQAGARIPTSATVTLDVGDGYVAVDDTLAVDSILEAEAGYESLNLF